MAGLKQLIFKHISQSRIGTADPNQILPVVWFYKLKINNKATERVIFESDQKYSYVLKFTYFWNAKPSITIKNYQKWNQIRLKWNSLNSFYGKPIIKSSYYKLKVPKKFP